MKNGVKMKRTRERRKSEGTNMGDWNVHTVTDAKMRGTMIAINLRERSEIGGDMVCSTGIRKPIELR